MVCWASWRGENAVLKRSRLPAHLSPETRRAQIARAGSQLRSKARHHANVRRSSHLRSLRAATILLERRNEAASRFHELTVTVPSGIPFPDNVTRIKAASQEYTSALQAVEDASKAQADFLLNGLYSAQDWQGD